MVALKRVISAIEPIPMDAARKRDLLASLKEINQPLALDRVMGLIILLDLNNTIQNFQASKEETDRLWKPLITLYNELKADTREDLDSATLEKYARTLIRFNQEQKPSLQKGKGRKR